MLCALRSFLGKEAFREHLTGRERVGGRAASKPWSCGFCISFSSQGKEPRLPLTDYGAEEMEQVFSEPTGVPPGQVGQSAPQGTGQDPSQDTDLWSCLNPSPMRKQP